MQSSSNLAIRCKNVAIYYPSSNSILPNKKSRDGFWALKDVSFELNRGDILGVVGSNGAGKSTILSVISGIMEPDQGTIETFGYTSLLLSINAGMSQMLSGRKNIFLMGLTLGIPKKIIEEKMNEIIEFTGLGNFIDRPMATYSTGMKTRLGFSTALYLEPDIFLIDEALGVGDQEFKKKSSEALQKKLQGHTTAIIVSHSEKTVKNLCNKAILMEQGKSIAFGTPDEIFKIYNEV